MSTAASVDAPSAAPQLLRVVGRWDLVALVINGIVGAGIFGLPAKVDALIGAWGVLAIIACAVLIGVIVLCFAEVSSRYAETGGPFLYATDAFGPFVGFVVGWLLWLARIAGICAIVGILAEYVAFLVPGMDAGLPRTVLLTVVILGFTALHIAGVRQAVRIGNLITIAKLVPLVLFVAIGLPTLNADVFDLRVVPDRAAFSSSVLLLGFAFVGWETAVVAAGELREPKRDTPFALFVGLAIVVVLYAGIQLVCRAALPQLATSTRPLADAAAALIGPIGGTVIVLGAAVSMLGTINGGMLTISRIPYAMATAGLVPRQLARLHPTTHSPVTAIVLSAGLVLLLSLTSTHVYVLTLSTIARLLVFGVTCAALPVLRRTSGAPAARFTVSGGLAVPVAALVLIGWLLTSTSGRETLHVVYATVIGSIGYAIGRWRAAAR